MSLTIKGVSMRGGITLSEGSTPPSPLTLEYVTTESDQVARLFLTGATATIDWGDNTSPTAVTAGISTYNHTYTNAGTYTVTVSGSVPRLGTSSASSYFSVIGPTSVIDWGNVGLTSLERAFLSCAQIVQVPTNLPSTVTNLARTFQGTLNFNSSNITSWDTSNVTNMSGMFEETGSFNQNIGSWNTSNVTNMAFMFTQASSFNQNIGSWNTGNVVNMSYMFSENSVFNQDISGWNTSNVIYMDYMFFYATSFNQNIARNGNSWNTVNVISMNAMFSNATSFNQNLSNWCVSQIAEKPEVFDVNTSSWSGGSATRPQWGTCPP